jgi:hypothetical protein
VEEQTVMPFYSYELYQVERPKSAREMQHANEEAARFAAAVSSAFLAIARAVRRPYSVAVKGAASPMFAESAACRGAMAR